MAPSKAQPVQPAKSAQPLQVTQPKTKTTASGHNAKKQTANPTTAKIAAPLSSSTTTTTSVPGVAATRPVVFPAIPLPMMQKQSARSSSAAAAAASHKLSKASTPMPTNQDTNYGKPVPLTKGSPNDSPDASSASTSLDAALINKVVSPGGTAKPTKSMNGQHMQSAKPSGGEVNGLDVEKPEQVATQTNAVPATTTITMPDAAAAPSATTAAPAIATATGIVTDTATDRANASPDQARVLTNGTNGFTVQSGQITAAKQMSSDPFSADVKLDTAGSTAVSVPAVDTQQGKSQLRSRSQTFDPIGHSCLRTFTVGVQDTSSRPSQAQSVISPRRIDQPHVLNPQNPPIPPPQYQPPTDRHPDHRGFHPGARMHHHHMSNGGGIMFGGLPESHTPSPAPHPGAFMPPPPMPVNGENPNFPRVNGHHHAQSNGNGFPGPGPGPAPINTQFRPDMVPVSSMDTYGPLSAHAPQGPLDAFPPGPNRYGPPTPHSFQGSHTSGELNGMEGGPIPFPPGNNVHYPGPGLHELPGGHHHQRPPHPHHPPGPPFPPFLPSPPFARRPPSLDGEIMDSISYFRNQFDNRELADCVLELVYTNGRHHPVKITGHKLILAQSPVLKRYIVSARRTDSSGTHTITVESSDAYLRSDAWWMAIQRLYMHPLLNFPPMIGNGTNGMDFAGDNIDRFEFCLGYVAAGHLLDMQDVLIRGLQIAADLLNWVTVEVALGFVLEGAIQRHSDFNVDHDGTSMSFVELEYNYGRETKILMDAIMNFLVNAFPANFEFDSTAADPPKYARIPAIPSPSAVTSPRSSTAPAIARGSNSRKGSKPVVRLSSIKFGDLPPTFPEDGPASQRESAKCSPILSRILLNLPFDELRAVLTSESNGVSGWNARDQYHAIASVVAAREAKRLRAVDAVRDGTVPHSQHIQKRLSSHRRHIIAEPWDVLNWKEEVIQPRGAEVPQLIRKWIPQFETPPERDLPRQAPAPVYNIPESMV